ncbi:MAG: pentapeptide repeat-containing protein [Anaerolineae bacterium]|nr:pentapeptide repeat-containing protein [Anaerolineae bacterium]
MAKDYIPDRWEEIQQLHQENRTLYQILAGILLITIGVIIGAALFGADSGYDINLFTEVLSLGVTVFVLDLLAKQREDRVLKKRLLQQLGSSFNVIALTALEELWHRGWVQDGSLAGTSLSRADLRGADFSKANLTGVRFVSRRYGHARLDETTRLPDETFWKPDSDIGCLDRFTNPNDPNYWRGFGLREANLSRRDLSSANLRGADLFGSNLWNTNLTGANLENAILIRARMRQAKLGGANLAAAELDDADLRQADLAGANLEGADMPGANLEEADLQGANLNGARLLGATLPNGQPYATGSDLSAFGASGQPDDSDRPYSPSAD